MGDLLLRYYLTETFKLVLEPNTDMYIYPLTNMFQYWYDDPLVDEETSFPIFTLEYEEDDWNSFFQGSRFHNRSLFTAPTFYLYDYYFNISLDTELVGASEEYDLLFDKEKLVLEIDKIVDLWDDLRCLWAAHTVSSWRNREEGIWFFDNLLEECEDGRESILLQEDFLDSKHEEISDARASKFYKKLSFYIKNIDFNTNKSLYDSIESQSIFSIENNNVGGLAGLYDYFPKDDYYTDLIFYSKNIADNFIFLDKLRSSEFFNNFQKNGFYVNNEFYKASEHFKVYREDLVAFLLFKRNLLVNIGGWERVLLEEGLEFQLESEDVENLATLLKAVKLNKDDLDFPKEWVNKLSSRIKLAEGSWNSEYAWIKGGFFHTLFGDMFTLDEFTEWDSEDDDLDDFYDMEEDLMCFYISNWDWWDEYMLQWSGLTDFYSFFDWNYKAVMPYDYTMYTITNEIIVQEKFHWWYNSNFYFYTLAYFYIRFFMDFIWFFFFFFFFFF